jgi:hypothetical protein
VSHDLVFRVGVDDQDPAVSRLRDDQGPAAWTRLRDDQPAPAIRPLVADEVRAGSRRHSPRPGGPG